MTFRLIALIISRFLPKPRYRLPHLLSSISSPPPPSSLFPVGQPATVKTHNIIERTANFVCQQGAQFEIVLKAKQAGNSQFDFLRFDHYLNPYYKHVLRAMKEGRYQLASGSQQPPQGESMCTHPAHLHPQLTGARPTCLLQTPSQTTLTTTAMAVTSTPACWPPRRAPDWRSW